MQTAAFIVTFRIAFIGSSALATGMNDHIAKPIDVGKLKETIAKFV